MSNLFNRGLNTAVSDLFGEEALILAVWVKGRRIPGLDPAVWRGDALGNLMRFADHGDRGSEYGWEKDHIIPIALGGSDHIDNLRPLHHRANASRGGILGGLLNR
jgi:5-methylcytosine-specific restriction endonuclease McrA